MGNSELYVIEKTMICTRKGFTLIELLVVIAVIALLMAILMPALQRAKKQAKSAACQMNLHQWGIIWSMYTSDNDGYFHQGAGGFRDERWPNTIRSYYSREPKIRCCPDAPKTRVQSEGYIGSFSAWGVFTGNTRWWQKGDYGSYGLNWWLCNTPSPPGGNYYPGQGALVNNWRHANVKGAAYIPIFFDCSWYGVWPREIDQPPEWDGQPRMTQHTNEMIACCINRHQGTINSAFVDWSVRKVRLKKLWTLKWHREYNTEGPWTTAGGCGPSDWPEWMRHFKDY